MNKSDVINQVAEHLHVKKEIQIRDCQKAAQAAVNIFLDSITHALKIGDRVEIRGLGAFSTKKYGSYTGRNPRTGESVEVEPKVLPTFKVGRELKRLINPT